MNFRKHYNSIYFIYYIYLLYNKFIILYLFIYIYFLFIYQKMIVFICNFQMNLVFLPKSLHRFLKLHFCETNLEAYLEAYSVESGTSKVKVFVKKVKSWKRLTNCVNSSILDVYLGCEYATANRHQVIHTSWYRLFPNHCWDLGKDDMY